VAEGLLRPKKLALIATPFQFVATPEKSLGMGRDTYAKFRANYAKHPERALMKGWELIHKDDVNAAAVRAHLAQHDPQAVLQKDWLRWLDILDGFTFEGAALAHFPPTLLLHGDRDLVAEHAQSERFAQALPEARLITYKGAGHAPHWHDTKAVTQAITEFLHV
jgi:pimeloyl-[acyl-carrier protein] methyl ester esterase